jgi:hypothetical protein
MVVSFFLNLAKNKSIEEVTIFHKLLFDHFKFAKPFGASTKKNPCRAF